MKEVTRGEKPTVPLRSMDHFSILQLIIFHTVIVHKDELILCFSHLLLHRFLIYIHILQKSSNSVSADLHYICTFKYIRAFAIGIEESRLKVDDLMVLERGIDSANKEGIEKRESL